MIGKNQSEPALFQMVDLESLVPQDHRVRQIDAALDLSFVHEALAGCYRPGWGRPSVDPELILRMMILGVLYDFSDRRLCDEVRMHAGYRWFCRLNFHDPVPDHSTLSRLRNERWAGSDVFTRLFEEVLKSCVSAGIVSGRHVSIDGTQIRANASMSSLERDDDQVQDNDEPPDQPPSARAAKQVQSKGAPQLKGKRFSNKTHSSRTDPDARLYSKSRGTSVSLSFLVHDIIDTKGRVILGRRASIATGRAEREVALELIAEHEAHRHILGLDQAVEVLTADAGYGAGSFVAELLDRGITPHVPLLSASEMEVLPTWQRRTFSLARQRKRCVKRREAEARNKVRLESKGHGYALSRKRRMRSEHIFAEAKNQHGLGRARHRSLAKVDRQSMLIATVQNLKRLMKALRNNAKGAEAAVLRGFDALYHAIFRSMINWEAAWPPKQKEPDLQPIAAHAAKMVRLSVTNPT